MSVHKRVDWQDIFVPAVAQIQLLSASNTGMTDIQPEDEANNQTSNSGWIFSKRTNAKSKSKNTGALLLYDYILFNEESDTDFWDSVGNDDLIAQMLQLENVDWVELEEDLPNWTVDQLEILSDCLIHGDNENKAEVLISKRRYLAGYIFTIVNDNDGSNFSANIQFFIDGQYKPLNVLFAILEKFKRISVLASCQNNWEFQKNNFGNLISTLNLEIEKASR